MAALTGEGQKIFMVAIPALHPGKAVVQVPAFQVAVNDLLKVGTPEPVWPFEPRLLDFPDGLAGLRSLRCPKRPVHNQPQRPGDHKTMGSLTQSYLGKRNSHSHQTSLGC
jgi:hypothetical protein